MKYIRIGFRNLIKNFRKTRISTGAIIIGMIACVMTEGFFNWQLTGWKESIVKSTGHYQLFKKGYSEYGDKKPYDYLITDYGKITGEIIKNSKVDAYTVRSKFSGIISTDDKSAIIGGMSGMETNEEAFETFGNVKGNGKLAEGKENGIIIGKGLAKRLNVKTGDSMTIMSGAVKGGGLNAEDVEVMGISDSGQREQDNYTGIMGLKLSQKLSNTIGEAERIIVRLKKTNQMDGFDKEIKAICAKYNLEYKKWDEIAVFYSAVRGMMLMVFKIIAAIVLVITVFTISNTINMNVFERIREIGTMRAVGTTRGQVRAIFVSEGMLMGITGATIGLASGYIIALIIEIIGGIPTGGGSHIFIRPDIINTGIFWILMIIVVVTASIRPAGKAGKILIADALRYT